MSGRLPASRIGAAVLIGATSLSMGMMGVGAAVTRLSPSSADAPDNFAVGRGADGEPCTATRIWHDPRLKDPLDSAWAITCRGVSASRTAGVVLSLQPEHADVADPKVCGAALSRTMQGVGPVEIRACYDPVLSDKSVSIRFQRRDRVYIAAVLPTIVGPAEVVLRTVAHAAPPKMSRDSAPQAIVTMADLAAPPEQTSTAGGAGRFDPSQSLQAGISLNRRGLYVEASSLLNDALSRVSDDTLPLTRAELELEAGLADSNISQFDSAADHFTHGEALIAAHRGSDRANFLEAKAATYRGFDAINARDWRKAIDLLAERSSRNDPLRDPVVLSRLNNSQVDRSESHALTSVDGAQLSLMLLEVQRNWARSVAYLALGEPTGSKMALDRAAQFIAPLQRSVDRAALIALKARIQRQYGRIAARQGKVDEALANFDCAIATLQGTARQESQICALSGVNTLAGAQTASDDEPMIAETSLERASLLARRPGVASKEVLASFGEGVDALIASGSTGAVPASLESYLAFLAHDYQRAPSDELAERFFRAVQAVGQPAIARQVAQLQTVVSAGGTIGAEIRDRAEAERSIIRLRYQIAAGGTPDADVSTLEKERAEAEAKVAALSASIGQNPRYRTVDDQAATVADIRAVLRDGEVYLKLTRLRDYSYAIAIDRQHVQVYQLDALADDVDAVAQQVRESIRNDSGRLPFFDVAASYALFKLIAGPAEPMLLSAKAIVVDPSGPLENLPAGVLVTSADSVSQYDATRGAAPNDYSKVAFLAANKDLANALSPRAFLISRHLPTSRAPDPFIGFGQNAPPQPATSSDASRLVAFGTGCALPYSDVAQVMANNKPVSADEIGIAAQALGLSGAPEVTGAAFNDAAIRAAGGNGDYARYQVLHFATHGVPETRWRCTTVPPSLITTIAPPPAQGAIVSTGLLTFSDIARLRLDANLVVLSACETAGGVSGVSGRLGGQDESSRSLDGLVRAFITANSRAVMATYWQVPASQVSDDLMRAFYAAGRDASIGDALRTAQSSIIAQPAFSHPYYWGAYFVVGDTSKTMLSAPSPQTAMR